MSKINRHPVRRTAAGVLAGALALSGAVAAATPAFAGPGFALERVAGDNRYETSAAIAAQFGATSGAILASGETGRSVDALSANFLAGVQGVPVLLTQRDRVPASVMARLNALTGAKNVTIVGGTVAVSAAVETSLRSMGFTVTRLGGVDRYATSEAIITAGRASASPIGLVASGTSFPDALAGGPLSYKGKHPVFLTSGGGLPQDTIDAMVAAGTRQVIILGGTAAVPASVEAALAARNITVVTRLGGAGRSETSRIIADYLINSAGFTNTTFNVASGVPRGEGVDALSGAALSGKENRALLVTDNVTSAAPVVAFATARAATLNAVGDIFGGPAAVATALEVAIETAGQAAGQFQTLNVTPTEAATLQLADETSTNTAAVRNADNRTYTVSGLTAGTRYRVTLVNAASIQGTGTNRTFLSSAIAGSTTAFGVDVGADIADIVSVNGATPTNNGVALDAAARTATAVPVAGSITFEIDGTAPGTVVPAVYIDGGQGGTATTGGADVRLETSATAAGGFAAATETFGLGGPTTYINPAAASGNFGTFAGGAATAVQSVSKASNQYDSGNVTFTYDANDIFRVGGVPATLDEFEARLSSGDTVSASYSATAGAVSTFELSDTNPAAPATVSAQAGGGANSNDISVTVSVTADVDAVVIQRAPVTGTGNEDEATTGSVGTFATVATVTPTAAQLTAGSVVFIDENVAVGSYRYRAAVVNDGQQSPFTADTANEASTAPAADTTSPQATATTRTTDAGLAGILDAGDVFTVRTNEALATPAAGSVIRIQDADGTIVNLVVGTNATAAVNAAALPATPAGPNAGAAAGTVLTVTVTGAPTVVAAGTTADLQYNNATITNTSGVNDVAGNRFDIAAGDRVIDAAAAPVAPTALTAAGTTAETGTPNDTFEAGEAFTITFSRALNPTGVGSTSTTLTFTDTDGTTGTITCAADCVLTSGDTVLTIPNGGLPTGTGGTAGFQGPLSVSATTNLRSADNGTAVSVPFPITV